MFRLVSAIAGEMGKWTKFARLSGVRAN